MIKFTTMNIKTTNPVIVDEVKVSPNDYFSNAVGDIAVDYEYLPTEEVTAGDIKVVTKYPIILDGSDVSPKDYYSNFWGRNKKKKTDADKLAEATENAQKTGQAPSTADQNVAKQKGLFWDNLKKSWTTFSNSEAGKMALAQVDAALTARRETRFGAGQGGGFISPDTITPEQPSQPMSATTKILLIGGGLLVVGLIVYSVISSKGATATGATK